MTRAPSPRGLGARLALFVALALSMSACAPLGVLPPGTPDAPENVAVVLYDAAIDVWPSLVGPGKVSFDIVNHGTLAHGFRVTGPGVDEQSDELFGPDEHRHLTVKLGPGTYRLFCPDADHLSRGMLARLVVTDSPVWFRR
jgi:hypothetical protein